MNKNKTPKRAIPDFRLLSEKMVATFCQTIRYGAGIFLLALVSSPSAALAEETVDLTSLPDREIQLLILGDSLSSGYGLQGDGWVALANAAFANAEKKITIVNDSISGDTTAGGVARVQDSLNRTKPDWVVIELGGNDGLRGLPPKIMEKNLTEMVEIAQLNGAKTMLLGIRIPPNYGRSYTEKFEQMFVNVSKNTNSPLLPFFIGKVGGDPALSQADMIHPNDAAQPIIRDIVLHFITEILSEE